MIINLTECLDQFDNIMQIGDIVLYRPEGRSPSTYKGKIKTIQLKTGEKFADIVLTITAVSSPYDKVRIGIDTKKLSSANVFALQP